MLAYSYACNNTNAMEVHCLNKEMNMNLALCILSIVLNLRL
jgi:hypothetical protein